MLSIVYPNQSNFERFVIFSTLAHVERLPGYLVWVIGYEIAHIISLEGRVSLSKSDIHSVLKSREYAKSRERSEKFRAF